MDISDIISAILTDNIRITNHAYEEALNDDLTFDEILYSSVFGHIIEEYPEDTPFPSCLVFGRTFSDDPVHTVWAYDDVRQISTLVTVYRPDTGMWTDWRDRRDQI